MRTAGVVLVLFTAAGGANGQIQFQEIGKKAGLDFRLRNDAGTKFHQIELMVGGIAALDFNKDGCIDLFLTNGAAIPSLRKTGSEYYNRLYRNNCDGTFTDITGTAGVAGEGYSMAAATADFDNDGYADIFVAGVNRNLLYRNLGNGRFEDVTVKAGMTGVDARSGKPWSISAGWFDYDNDGWLDLMFVNGHIYPAADRLDWGTSYAQRPLLFHNEHDGKFTEVPPVKGTALGEIVSGRGAAFGDLFNDGKVDVVVSQMDRPLVLLRNINPDHHHWVELKLVGGEKSPRDAVGATVFLTANGIRQRQDVMSGGSYVSTNDRRPHFGLGDATEAGTAEVHWPSGTKETIKLPAVDRIYIITEGKGITSSLCAGKPCAGPAPTIPGNRP